MARMQRFLRRIYLGIFFSITGTLAVSLGIAIMAVGLWKEEIDRVHSGLGVCAIAIIFTMCAIGGTASLSLYYSSRRRDNVNNVFGKPGRRPGEKRENSAVFKVPFFSCIERGQSLFFFLWNVIVCCYLILAVRLVMWQREFMTPMVTLGLLFIVILIFTSGFCCCTWPLSESINYVSGRSLICNANYLDERVNLVGEALAPEEAPELEPLPAPIRELQPAPAREPRYASTQATAHL